MSERAMIGARMDETGKPGKPGKTLSTQDRHSETLEMEENQGRRLLKRRRYTSLVYMHITIHRWGCSRLSAWLSNKRHDMVLHCPAYDGVVVWPVAPIPGDFSDKSCMAHGFENMRKPRMRPLLKLPSTPPRQPKPNDALVQSHQQEHGTFYRFHSARVSKR